MGKTPQTLCIKGGLDRRWYRKAAGAVVKRLGLLDTGRAYQLEAMFYHDLAPAVKASLPRCWFAEADTVSGQGIVILDDLVAVGVSFGDPTRPWSVDRVAAAQRKVDQLRHRGLADSLRRHGVSKQKANTYATIAIATLAGMQVTQRPFKPASLRAVYDELAKALGKDLLQA